MPAWCDPLGLALGVALDRLIADPQSAAHPVAVFGRVAARVEKSLYADKKAHGVAYVAICVGGATALGVLAQRVPRARTVVTAVATWAVLGGTTLAREGEYMADALEGHHLEGDDLEGDSRKGDDLEGDGRKGDGLERARARLPHLCGRDPSHLEAKELARATVESLAENTSDAVVAPLFWGAVAGVPGLLAYRAINTLDAMVGHRSPRYERFGWAAARLDDVANYVPARLTGLLTVLTGPDPGRALAVLRRDGHRHPSPNAGRCEAAFAGALGVTLGGTNVYQGRTEHRPTMGDGPEPDVKDIRRAVRLTRAVSLAAAGAAVLTAWALRNRRK
ncbi:cobalamin biosynthesis protein [Nonomuraea jabiensis]|uniref:cobalamin biosynthesis protein n=1 Tax=Nonomuraea jabiensis TaxID=882448 RepID=UPI00341EDAD1